MFHHPLTLSSPLPPAMLREQQLSARMLLAGFLAGFGFMLALAAFASLQPARRAVSPSVLPRHAATAGSLSSP